jgi:RHS repeat-associated protein
VIVWRWDSDPFGTTAASQDPDGDSDVFAYNLRLPGQYFDSETGLHYNYFRDYDPATGRYVQSDPIGLAGGLNTYLYANSNTLSFIDPLGLETLMCRTALHALGGKGERSGPDVWGNPLYHQFLCIPNGKGGYSCGGQDRRKGPWGPGKPSTDEFTPKQCEKVEPDNKCIEQCLLKKFGEKRPNYGLVGVGTNCQEWADDSLDDCRKECNKK